MKSLASLVALLSLAVVASCGSGDPPPPPLPEYTTAGPYTDAACNVEDGALTGQRELRLFRGGAVDVLSLTQGLARYYKRHSLTFFTNAQPQPAGTTYAVDTNEAALTTALVKAFPGVNLANEQALMADPVLWNQIVTFVGNFMLRPIIEFARAHGTVGPDATNFVVLPDLERPGGEKLGEPGTVLAGLAISPPLLAEFNRTMPDEGMIWQGIDLPPGFTPMMFLGSKVIAQQSRRDPVLLDLIVAHEFGHTGGLPHSTIDTNLMFPSKAAIFDTCLDSLSTEQLAALRTNLGLVSATTGALTNGEPRQLRPSAPAARPPRFTPADLRALLGGDARAMRRFLEPLLETVSVRAN